jgi:hypothetical protein
MPAQQFQEALHRLVTSAEYRQDVQSEPDRLLRDFELTPGELGLLHAVWEATGVKQEDQKTRGLLLCHWSACCCCFWER